VVAREFFPLLSSPKDRVEKKVAYKFLAASWTLFGYDLQELDVGMVSLKGPANCINGGAESSILIQVFSYIIGCCLLV